MKFRLSSAIARTMLGAAVVTSLGFHTASAATYYWEGVTSTNWGTSGNWSNTAAADGAGAGTVPLSTDSIVFNTTGNNTNRTVALEGNRTVAGITFSSTGTLLLSSTTTSALTVGSGGIVMNAGSGNVTVGTGQSTSAPIRISTSQTWTNNSTSGTFRTENSLSNSSATAATLTFDGVGNFVINNNITVVAGVLSLVKNGTGTLELNGANVYTGTLTLNNGIVLVNSDARLGAPVAGQGNLIFGGGTLRASDNFTTARATTLNSGGGTFDVLADKTLTHNGVISGNGGLTKSGAGALVIGGANTYTGATSVTGSSILFSTRAALNGGVSTNWSSVTVASGATFGVTVGATGFFTSTDVAAILSSSNFSAGGLLGLAPGSNGYNYTAAITNAAGGSTGINKLGGNTLILSGTNTYTGTTVVSSGILQFDNVASLYGGDTSKWISSNFQIASGATLAFGAGSAGQFTAADIATLLGTNIFSTAGTRFGIATSTADFTYSSAITDPTAGGTLSFSKSGAQTLNFTGTAGNTYTGTTYVVAGTLNMNKTGGAQSIAGNVSINGGTLNWSQNNQVADTADVSISGGAATLNGKTETINNLTITGGNLGTGGGGVLNANNVVLTGATGGSALLTLNTSTTAGHAMATFNSLTLSGVNFGITGSSGGNILIGGSGLTAVTTLTVGAGGMSMSGQSIQFNRPSEAAGMGSQILLNGNFTGSGTNAFGYGAAGTPAVTGKSAINLGGGNRTFNISSGITTVGIKMTNGTLTKTGTGTLILNDANGTNDYTGTTTVSAGKLLLNSNQSLATGAVTVASGATLGGTGTVGGATTISGIHAAGGTAGGADSIGTQTFSSGLSYASGSTFSWQIGAQSTSASFDRVIVGGQLDISTGSKFDIVMTGVDINSDFWTTTQTWDIFDAGSTVGNFGTFTLYDAAAPTVPIIYGSKGYFSYIPSTGTLQWAVPEPSNALAGLLIAAGLLRRRRTAAA